MVNYFLLDFVSISVLLFIKFTIYQVFLKLVFVLALIFSYEAHKEISAPKQIPTLETIFYQWSCTVLNIF